MTEVVERRGDRRRGAGSRSVDGRCTPPVAIDAADAQSPIDAGSTQSIDARPMHRRSGVGDAMRARRASGSGSAGRSTRTRSRSIRRTAEDPGSEQGSAEQAADDEADGRAEDRGGGREARAAAAGAAARDDGPRRRPADQGRQAATRAREPARALRRSSRTARYIPFLLGNLYFDKHVVVGLDGPLPARAIKKNGGYRNNAVLNRNVIRMLASAQDAPEGYELPARRHRPPEPLPYLKLRGRARRQNPGRTQAGGQPCARLRSASRCIRA